MFLGEIDTYRGIDTYCVATDEHFPSLKDELKGKSVSVIVDETTDDRDKSVLNVLVGNLDKVYLIDTVFVDEVNQRTVAQTVLKSLIMRGLRMTMCAVSSQITPLTAKRLSTIS